jgi:hypothetical protein
MTNPSKLPSSSPNAGEPEHGVMNDELSPEKLEVITWYKTVLAKYREAVNREGLTEGFQISSDFRAPFQVSVIWVTDPEFQIVIQSRFPEMSDMDFRIRGPEPISKLLEMVQKELDESKWDRPRSLESGGAPNSTPRSLVRESLNTDLMIAIDCIRSELLSPGRPKDNLWKGYRVEANCWLSLISGNIVKTDPATFVEHVIRGLRQPSKSPQVSPPKPRIMEEPKLATASMTYFFPPIHEGKVPQPATMRERFTQTFGQFDHKLVVSQDIAGAQLKIYRDGRVIVVGLSPSKSVGILNVLFALARMSGLRSRAVAESEISAGEFNVLAGYLTSWEVGPGQHRADMAVGPFYSPLDTPSNLQNVWRGRPRPIEVPGGVLQILAGSAAEVSKDQSTSEDLQFWNLAETYFESKEYSQSFIMSWIVVERNLNKQWSDLLTDKGVSGKLHTSLIEQVWRTDPIIDILAQEGKLTDEEPKLLKELVKKRNRLVHGGETVERTVAAKSLTFARKVVVVEVSKTMSRSEPGPQLPSSPAVSPPKTPG